MTSPNVLEGHDVPEGYEVVRFGELRDGDVILGSEGPTEVRRGYAEHMPERMFEVEQDDGTTVRASGNHRWYVETEFDRAGRFHRFAQAKKLFRREMSEHTERELVKLAEFPSEAEISAADMVALFTADDGTEPSHEMIATVLRAAKAIGHVKEDTVELRDPELGQVGEGSKVWIYDARVFAAELLALAGRKKYGKPRVGRVVTTVEINQLVSRGMKVYIPAPNQQRAQQRRKSRRER